MTSVPKPLKFLRPHLQTLKDTYAKLAEGDNKKLLADIISLLAMTDAPVDNVMPESLKYRLVGSDEDIGTWGHEAGLDTRLLDIARNNLILSLVCVYCFAFLRQLCRFHSLLTCSQPKRSSMCPFLLLQYQNSAISPT